MSSKVSVLCARAPEGTLRLHARAPEGTLRLLHLLGALCLLTTACAEDAVVYAGTEFEVQSAPPSPASFQSDRIELMAGVAVKVLATPRSSGELDYTSRDLVSLSSDDSTLLEVFHTENEREFVLVGVEAGTTCLEVSINRDQVDCIDVRVLPPITE